MCSGRVGLTGIFTLCLVRPSLTQKRYDGIIEGSTASFGRCGGTQFAICVSDKVVGT